MSGIELIQWKRTRQELQGYTGAHDDQYTMGELANAAAFLAVTLTGINPDDKPSFREPPFANLWPAAWEFIEPDDRIEELAHAGALIVAEIERLQRLQAKQAASKGSP